LAIVKTDADRRCTMRRVANIAGSPRPDPFAAEYRTPNSQVLFIAAVVLAVLAVWGAATCLVSLPLSLDQAVLLS
jgi:hypothetical protein